MSNDKWTMEDKLRAAFAYIITGSTPEAELLCNIPDRTIRNWTETTWWPELIAEAKTKKNAELDALYTRIIDKAIRETEDRLINGEEVITKDGDRLRKLVTARDAAIIAATFQDKRAIIRGEPTSITKRVNERERLKQLADGLHSVDEETRTSKPEYH